MERVTKWPSNSDFDPKEDYSWRYDPSFLQEIANEVGELRPGRTAIDDVLHALVTLGYATDKGGLIAPAQGGAEAVDAPMESVLRLLFDGDKARTYQLHELHTLLGAAIAATYEEGWNAGRAQKESEKESDNTFAEQVAKMRGAIDQNAKVVAFLRASAYDTPNRGA